MHVSKIIFLLIFQKGKNKVLSSELNSQQEEKNFKLVAMVIPFLYAIPTQLCLMAFGLSNEMEGKD
jgi:hypothetical protein